ncbi:MAG: molybdopterin oxidoreductase family protein, partial [Halobacteriaceae archaeon]
DEEHPGTERLYAEEFNTPDGRANLTPVGYSEPAETPDDRYPLTLTTGRVLYQYHTGTMTHRQEGIMEYVDGDFVEVNPETAADIGISDGELAKVESRRGAIAVPVQITERPGPGTVFVPMHFAETAVNVLTAADHLDEPSGTPEYKVTSVRITPFEGDEPGIVFKNRTDDGEPSPGETAEGADTETSADD